VLKLPVLSSVSVGYRGGDWKEKIWKGTIKVVERGDHCGIVLSDSNDPKNIFAVCPYMEGAVERCVDSSRYFVLRIENANNRHMFIGVAFNERNDAFDFNTSMEDARREREIEKMPRVTYSGPQKDYSLKHGQKIHVNIPTTLSSSSKTTTTTTRNNTNNTNSSSKHKAVTQNTANTPRFLKPNSKDTPRRAH
jgi:hypothetical protein